MKEWQVIELREESIPELARLVWNHLDRENRDLAVEYLTAWLQSSNKLRIAGLASISTVDSLENSHATRSGGRTYVAGAYLQEFPGRIAALVGPAYSPQSSHFNFPSLEVLVHRLVEKGREWKVELVQSIFDCETPFDRKALSLGGLKHLTNLYQMDRSIEPSPATNDISNSPAELPGRYQFRDYRDLPHLSWIRWLEATYQQTSDCPELNGLRSTTYALEGYRANSKTSMPAWFGIVDADDENQKIVAGVMLSQTGPLVWEITYLGVIPEFRRKGLARKLITKAIETVRIFGGTRLWLAVDQRNLEAIKLYREQNFSIQRTLEAWFTAISKNLN